ncbi:hypothetical protein TREPR_3384 [Treponema primitia ZAS-2]|uniref:Uncharacterized protein n=1 Tax=Treponema primitia (strain ATCC BAA-887 / DSM 12427 / ZAS-2) TaxID=545694 RepID=F5YJM7_TREPZ|nr:hypothetical protein [Treponema primitia]AEF84005.1 hypothetical protein TREPR_3384 [Treponema primitia ZAS-2]
MASLDKSLEGLKKLYAKRTAVDKEIVVAEKKYLTETVAAVKAAAKAPAKKAPAKAKAKAKKAPAKKAAPKKPLISSPQPSNN